MSRRNNHRGVFKLKANTPKSASAMNKPYVHICDSCREPITGDKVRISISPPGRSWIGLIFHDLICMLDFFEVEMDAEDPKDNRVFIDESYIECIQLSSECGPQATTLTASNERST